MKDYIWVVEELDWALQPDKVWKPTMLIALSRIEARYKMENNRDFPAGDMRVRKYQRV